MNRTNRRRGLLSQLPESKGLSAWGQGWPFFMRLSHRGRKASPEQFDDNGSIEERSKNWKVFEGKQAVAELKQPQT